MRNRTLASKRSWRRETHRHPPCASLSSCASIVSRVLVVWSLCLALQQAPRVASSAASSVPGTVPAWQQPFQGSPSSDDEGSDDIESKSQEKETQQRLPFVVIPNKKSSPTTTAEADSLPGHEALNQEETLQQLEEVSNVPLADSKCQDADDDGTVGTTRLESDEDDSETEDSEDTSHDEASESEEDHVVVVSGVEVEWFERDDSASGAGVKSITKAEEQPGHAEAVVKPDGRPDDDDDESRVTEGTRRAIIVEEVMDESDGEETEEEETEAPRVSSHAEQVDMEENGGESEDEDVPEEQDNPTQRESGLKTSQEVESEDEASDWTEDEKSVTDDGENDIDEGINSAAPPHHVASRSSEDGMVTTPEEYPISTPEKTDRAKAVPISSATVIPNKKQDRNTVRSKQRYQNPSVMASSSQPLKTLKKLQQMLDETDYMAAPGPRGDEVTRDASVTHSGEETMWFEQGLVASDYEENAAPTVVGSFDSFDNTENSAEGDKLWTSKDRMKYKKQQQRIRRARAEQRRLEHQLQSPPLYPNTSDGDVTDDSTDDGLGYSLPNLPVYFSDAEGTTDLTDTDQPSLQLHQSTQQQSSLQPPPPPFEQRGPHQHPGYQYPYNVPPLPEQNMGRIPPYMGYPPNPYLPYSPYGPYGPQQQQMYESQYAAAWAAASAGISPYGTARPPYSRQYPPQTRSFVRKPDVPQSPSTSHEPKSESSRAGHEVAHERVLPSMPEGRFPIAASLPVMTPATHLATMTNTGQPSTLAELSPKLNFDSLQKMSILAIGLALFCYSAVSPRTLPTVDYNMKFYENIKIVALTMIAPIFNFILVFDPKENDVNNAVNAFYEAVTIGYGLAFVLQLVFTTLIRLGVFSWFEPDVFKLTPQVPALVLPWVLRENRYRTKRITLFAADYATSCVAGPIIEEYVKLKILQWSSPLSRNFRWTTKVSTKNKKRKRKVAEVIPRNPGDPEVTNINSYISQMLAVSIGIKLCDSTRRILMYTKDHNANKGFYAFCRGIFPIHELCGTMTALALAKRDVLGWDMPLWKMLAPAVVVHGMANFRGMKPIFKWNSATPWSEMQLAPWNAAIDLSKGFGQFMWLIILGRVLGYCIKNYYLIRRQAVKRTTTYAGKRAAFSAELAAAEELKKMAKDK